MNQDDTPGRPQGRISGRLREDQFMTDRFAAEPTEAVVLQRRIATLEAHQDGRRAYIADTEGIIARKQLEIDNLRAQSSPTPQQRALQLWVCEDGEDAVCELNA